VAGRARSIAFDRAVAYYDRTRELPAATQRAMIRLLAAELIGRGRCLEIGVGTVRMALDLDAAGISMAGVDLSAPMLRRLVEKASGTPPFPLAQADATGLPFPDGAFGAALACHVLHLIDPWQEAARELVRVVRRGGVILVERGGASGLRREVRRHFFSLLPRRPALAGLDDVRELDGLMRGWGLGVRRLRPVVERRTITVERTIEGLERGLFAGCWHADEEARRSAAAGTRAWARERFGDLDAARRVEFRISWRAYDVPA
jgi:SAM-dependent methyltransferase